jgi:hypothetical protein
MARRRARPAAARRQRPPSKGKTTGWKITTVLVDRDYFAHNRLQAAVARQQDLLLRHWQIETQVALAAGRRPESFEAFYLRCLSGGQELRPLIAPKPEAKPRGTRRVSKAEFLAHRQQHPTVSNARGARLLSQALGLTPPIDRRSYIRYRQQWWDSSP